MRAGRVRAALAVAGVALALAVGIPLRATAQTADPQPGTDPGVAAAQARADVVANTYFQALDRSNQLDLQVADLEQNIAQLEQRVSDLRDQARARAVEAYKRSGSPLAAQFGDNSSAMESARRSVWLDLLNARDDNVATQLRHARDDLGVQKDQLETARQQQADLVNQLKSEQDRLNGELVAAQNERRGAGSVPAPRGSAPAPSSAYSPTPGENPHHNDPFLVCTRGIESGGNYQAYNASGPYYGAYQFTQSTWNATANHAGRGDLVGVDPRQASEYDQDEMAWTLYQWQGKGPWGGRC